LRRNIKGSVAVAQERNGRRERLLIAIVLLAGLALGATLGIYLAP
jgi:hypothetical protein